MFRGVSAILLILFIPLCGTHVSEYERKERALYFQKLVRLYDVLGLNGGDRARQQVLMGMVSDAINTGKSPREERALRDVELIHFSGGSFEALLLTESLVSPEYLHIKGTVDFSSFEIDVSDITELDIAHYVRDKYKAQTRHLKDTPVNNGSKGMKCFCRLVGMSTAQV